MTTSCLSFVGRTGQQAYPRDEALHFEHRIADVLRRADRQGETPRRASGLHRPCVAKRKEARRDECVDFVMTFEEINSIFDGLGIEVATTDPFPIPFVSTRAPTASHRPEA